MKVAVLRFPGSNCDADALHALRRDVGVDADYVWQTDTSLDGFDAVWVPGGFSYGDYLRCGAMAARAPIMSTVRDFAGRGGLVIGACNGFQVLCESGLLPGALVRNVKQRFICQNVVLEPATQRGPWMAGVNRTITLPIAHGEGRFVCSPETLKELQDEREREWEHRSHRRRDERDGQRAGLDAAPGTRHPRFGGRHRRFIVVASPKNGPNWVDYGTRLSDNQGRAL
jgi:phosphoribosylformylglycinamidine synthase I